MHILNKKLSHLSLALLSTGLVPIAFAAPSLSDINAQELIRQQERERAQQELLRTNPEVRPVAPAPVDVTTIPKSETPCF